MIPGPRKDAVINITRVTEFTGDDVDQYSKVVDLEGAFEFLAVYVPTIDSATITPYVQRDSHIDTAVVANGTVPVPTHFFHDNDADTDIAQATVASTGGYFIVFNIGGEQFVRIKASQNQTANRTFSVRGFNRG